MRILWEEKMDEKFWWGAEVYQQVPLLEISWRVKCKISFCIKKERETTSIILFSHNFHSQRKILHCQKWTTICPVGVFAPAKILNKTADRFLHRHWYLNDSFMSSFCAQACPSSSACKSHTCSFTPTTRPHPSPITWINIMSMWIMLQDVNYVSLLYAFLIKRSRTIPWLHNSIWRN